MGHKHRRNKKQTTGWNYLKESYSEKYMPHINWQKLRRVENQEK